MSPSLRTVLHVALTATVCVLPLEFEIGPRSLFSAGSEVSGTSLCVVSAVLSGVCSQGGVQRPYVEGGRGVCVRGTWRVPPPPFFRQLTMTAFLAVMSSGGRVTSFFRY